MSYHVSAQALYHLPGVSGQCKIAVYCLIFQSLRPAHPCTTLKYCMVGSLCRAPDLSSMQHTHVYRQVLSVADLSCFCMMMWNCPDIDDEQQYIQVDLQGLPSLPSFFMSPWRYIRVICHQLIRKQTVRIPTSPLTHFRISSKCTCKYYPNLGCTVAMVGSRASGTTVLWALALV